MTDTDLDRRVAEIVGWTRASAHDPTGCIEDAIAALEAMREKGWWWELDADNRCQMTRRGGGDWVTGEADSLPLAICRAIVATEEKS